MRLQFLQCRELGGFTQTVAGSLETVLKSFETNPRTTLVLEEFRHKFYCEDPAYPYRGTKTLVQGSFQ